MTTQLITLGLMEAATATLSNGTTASGYSLNSLLDFNPDVAWKSGASDYAQIDIDLGEAQTADWFGLWIPNYGDTSIYDGGSKAAGVYSDDNDDGNYTATTLRATSYTLGSLTSPLIIFASPTSATKRYWRIVFSAATASDAVQVSQVFLGRIRSVSLAHQWPDYIDDEYANVTVTGPGGRQFARGINQNKFGGYDRRWLLNGTTDFTAIQNAFDDSKGSRFPLIHREDSTYRYVRLAQDRFRRNQINYQIYDIGLSFVLIPYIDYGESY